MLLKTTKIFIPTLFSFHETLSFLDRGFDECLYNLTPNSVSKLINLSDGNGIITVKEKGEYLQIDLEKENISKTNLEEVVFYVKDWFDLDRNLSPFYTLLNKNEKLAFLADRYNGSRIIAIPNLFEALCWAIIGQQINLHFAYKLKRLLVEKYGKKTTHNSSIYYLFPSPAELVKAKREDLVKMKFSRQKIDYLMNISRAFLDGEISKVKIAKLSTKQEQLKKLTAVKGIGIWTANYVLMKAMKNMNCITYGDSGLNKAIHTIFSTDKKPSNAEIDAVFKHFTNWESYLNFYLWKSLST